MVTDQQLLARSAARLLGMKQATASRWTPLPHQQPPEGDWYGWLLLAGRGCVAPWTRIYDPSNGTETAVSELAKRNGPVTVLGLGQDGAVAVRCAPPFVKGVAEWIRFDLDDGTQITVTKDHRFLTPSGWRRARTIGAGHLLGCAADRLKSGDSVNQRPVDALIPGSWEGAVRWVHVAARAVVGTGAFYDIQVPGVHSYLAEGVWHHNSGKTDACAHYVHNHVNGPPCIPGPVPHWIGIIGPTHGDAVTSCFKGPSGLRVHSPGAKLVTAEGGTVVRWPNGSEAKIFGAHSEEDAERLRSGGNRSIAVGTPVHTERGQVPIEQVRVGERVWTRLGLRPVLGSWDHGLRPLWTVRTRSGRELRLTPDHKVWTRRGWVRCDRLSVNDTLSSWNMEITAGSVWARTGRVPSGTGADTGRSSFTGRSMKTTTAPSRTAGTFTTRTTTSRTTTPPTWRPGHPETTTGITPRVPNGTPLVDEHLDRARSRIAIASSVGFGSTPVGTAGSAPRSAGDSISFRQPPVCSHASCAAEISRSGESPLLSLALDPVETISPGSVEGHVWDLTVAGEHEFFANDLLVANCLIWAEELAAWRHIDAAWDHMRMGLRVGPRPHWVASTTPKPKPLIKKLNSGVVDRVVVTRASYKDNPYLPPEIKEALEDSYGGTQLGRQELYGEVIDQDENALWTNEVIDQYRVRPGDVPSLARISVGVDPSGGQGEQGIVVVGKSKPFALPGQTKLQAHGYVLDDRSCRLSPAGWGKRAVQAAIDWQADEIFAEVNYGGDMCVSTLRAACEDLGVNIPIRMVRATRGKEIRAHPVSALTVNGRWHHAGTFPELEIQMCTWYPELDWSPDRLDACLIKGTLVTTRRGSVPIEDVTTDDSVWTRKGWRSVVWSGMTDPNAEVMTVETTTGSFTATPDHRVWVDGRGFVRVDSLVWNDRLNACPGPRNRLFSAASRSLGSLSRKVVRRASTTRLTGMVGAFQESVSSTSRSGNRPTAWTKSRQATSSTTWTKIRSTTIRAISFASLARNTLNSTGMPLTETVRSGWRTLKRSAHWRRGGMPATRGVHGTPSMLGTSTSGASTEPSPARLAENRTRRGTRERPGSAPAHAFAARLIGRSGIARWLSAPSAEAGSFRASTGLFRRRARTRVVRTYALDGRQPVYDLTVDDQHEFYANGVLVHNCVWSAWGLRLVHTAPAGKGSLGTAAASRVITA